MTGLLVAAFGSDTRLRVTELIYGAVLLAGIALVVVRARRTRRIPWSALLGVTAAAIGLAVALGFGQFGFFGFARLLGEAGFGYGVVLAAGLTAALHGRANAAARGSALLGLLVLAVGVDAYAIEPHRLEVSQVEVRTGKLTRPIRVVVLSDLQMESFGAYERRVLDEAARQEPDLLLLPGDYIQLHDPIERAAVREAFRAYWAAIGLRAPLGGFAVTGNVDGPAWPAIFEGLGVTALTSTQTIPREEITITGLTLEDSFTTSLHVAETSGFHLVLGHAPDFALGTIEADLLVAGHTHGGQVRLPGFGPLMTLSAVPRSWAAGVTHLASGATLVVSRGLGMERGAAPRLRFLCRPEIVVITLTPASAP